ncbi:bifunctional phosphopantothenoylcysteine decarboxylase/phosphopantothenate--cysteine ligase CoaBC [Acidilutibacter cellobiosedens]|uniref:Coenzyme A biosynthesis bifunctional protein CoaBC n=1 Tax=Acidilutibacter cellobiosedens TaxID=2507161 RepID=A0A410QCJ6_9FIRM|nr:bifunctional phosphopantothenoylcysteine decarboxylase/phosphopantothenate--cysteine ligase CoaBC [Acidilutibacter cellobiosedens]QAT61548.1 bifunctional phosphopantothenoylcysteine decarboxylase/phosphopantothenate--cysteine ligase CoaBC [Acidilutibacter cellobiosedens]
MLNGKNILIGVSGGIACYKVCDVVSRLKKLNSNVDVIMTKSAVEFVSPLTFQTLSQNFVYVDMFKEPKTFEVEHISLAKKADIVLIAPATGNIIGKIASGIADDMLTTVIMATRAKVIFAPAMNMNMYTNPIVQDNIKKLSEMGYEFIKPGKGRLACGDYGEGKMAEPEIIVDYILNSFHKDDLKDKKIVITAGPTIEPLDPVRYMTNFSSGKMGYALAEEAEKRGGKVVLITGPVNLTPPYGVGIIKINTTIEMLNAVEKNFDDCDILIKAAAPLDYRPETVSKDKIKKNGESLQLKFVPNPDIAAYFGKLKKNQIIVGFAAETNNVIEYAKEKLKKKNFDFIVVNDISKDGAGFRTDTNIVSIIDNKDVVDNYPLMEKRKLAGIILDKAVELISKRDKL